MKKLYLLITTAMLASLLVQPAQAYTYSTSADDAPIPATTSEITTQSTDYIFKSIITAQNGDTIAVGIYNLSAFYSDAILVRYDAEGNLLWYSGWSGNGEDVFNDVIETTGGNLVIVGRSSSKYLGGLELHGTVSDAIIITMNPEGRVLWQRGWGGSGKDAFQSISENADGNLVATGYSYSYDLTHFSDSGTKNDLTVTYTAHGSELQPVSADTDDGAIVTTVIITIFGTILVISAILCIWHLLNKHKDSKMSLKPSSGPQDASNGPSAIPPTSDGEAPTR